MKKLIIGLVLIGAILVGLKFFTADRGERFGAFNYTAPTMATSSVGIYAWSSVLAQNTGRQFASFCHNGSTLSNDAIYLSPGSFVTSSPALGIRIPQGQCYTMTQDNLSWDTIYARASSATSTLLILYE